MPRRTRIVATIGPASRDPAVLRALLLAGVDVCRLNCSHATPHTLQSDIAHIRRLSTELGRPTAILLDLQGPKIRTGAVHRPLPLARGDLLTVVMDPDLVGAGRRIGTTWPRLADDVKVGAPVLFADGAILGTVVEVRPARDGPAEVDVRIDEAQADAVLDAHKGINLPRTHIDAPALTDKDRADLTVGVQAGVDYVALSFVRGAADILALREALAELGHRDLAVIAKIEKPQAVEHIDAILHEADGIMVARGDLGVEIPLEDVPIVQKELIAAANRQGALVITATQMLDSMERKPRPTRAEITDVANAILDGTDAVMLSGETATGRHPLEAVRVMDRIATKVESSAWYHRPDLADIPALAGPERSVCRAACYAVRDTPRPLVVFTWSGASAILASKSRPPGPIFALSPNATARDRLALAWGVTPVQVPVIDNTDALIAAGERALLDAGLVAPGEQVVVLARRTPIRGATNLMKVEVIDGRST